MLSSRFFVLLTFLVSACSVQAGVTVNTTRVIYLENDREVTIKLNNNGTKPVLVQSWLDNGEPDQSPSAIKVPFTLTPPITRIDADKGQTLRIFHTGNKQLPAMEESVFWLNVLEIPPKSQNLESENTLQLAFRTRIKLFFRPENLKGSALEAGKKLRWSVRENGLVAINPTPYHVSLSQVAVTVNDQTFYSEARMVAPNQMQEFVFTDLVTIPTNSKVSIVYIDDYGASISHDSVLGK